MDTNRHELGVGVNASACFRSVQSTLKRELQRGIKLSSSGLARTLKNIRVYSCSFVVLLAGTLASAQTFQQLRKTVSASPATQPEATIMQLLGMGLEEGKPTQAIMETEKWLRQNLPEDGMLLYKAAHAAELSGDWKSAVAYYQQYLEKADLKSDTADEHE